MEFKNSYFWDRLYSKQKEAIGDYYGGGTDAGGATGANYGVSFGTAAYALKNYPNSSTGNEPDGGYASLQFGSTGTKLMNVPAGFSGGFSFYYASPYFSGSVNVYSGLNATGTLLAAIPLAMTPNATTSPYNLTYAWGVWQAAGASFAGTAESVDFSGLTSSFMFADATLGSAAPRIGNSVPDDTGFGTCALAGLGLAGAAWALRKQAMAVI